MPSAVSGGAPQSLGTAALLNVGSSAGQIPIIPVPMSQLSDGVKTTIDAIRNNSDSAAYHSASEFAASAFLVVEVNVSDSPRNSGHFDITELSGLTNNNAAQVFQVAGPYTGKSPIGDDAEWDSLLISARCINSTTIRCWWTANSPVSGNFKFGYR